jgi:hypothetical protein
MDKNYKNNIFILKRKNIMALNLTMWKDILKETDPTGQKSYSQGRVYLLFSVIAYYITLGIVTWKALRPTTDIKEDTLKTIIDALQWAILLFAGYAFGGKVIGSIKTIFGKDPLPTDTAGK